MNMLSHKEQKKDEIFVGNSNIDQRDLLLSSGIECRLGDVAYDIHGRKLKTDIKPLFVKKSSFKRYDNKMRSECGFI